MPVQADEFAEFYEASYGRVVALVTAMTGDLRCTRSGGRAVTPLRLYCYR